MRRFTWLVTTALQLSPAVASSQEPPGIVPGSRIRITELQAGKSVRHSGTVVTAGADTVVLRNPTGGATATFPLARISGLEVSRGSKGHVAVGVGLGFLAGAGIGGLFGGVLAPSQSELGIYPYVGIGAVIGAGAGMLLGGVVGAAHKSDRWEAVPSSRWRVSTLPTGPGSFALSLSVRF